MNANQCALNRIECALSVQCEHALSTPGASIRYLARQGLALRGDGDEDDGNLLQLLKLKGEDDPAMLEWLKRKVNKYTSHEILNDII